MMKTWAYCPIHEEQRGKCSTYCLDVRIEHRKAAQALRTYWYARKNGERPWAHAYGARRWPRAA